LLLKTREAISALKLWELAKPIPSSIEKARVSPNPRSVI